MLHCVSADKNRTDLNYINDQERNKTKWPTRNVRSKKQKVERKCLSVVYSTVLTIRSTKEDVRVQRIAK